MKKILLLSYLFISSATFAQVNTILIGSSGNAYSVAFGARTNLWYDSVLNTVSFFHRSALGVNNSTTLDDIRYDYSTDGGTTWSSDQGPVYKANTIDTLGARYPQGVIYNPVGNTNPANSFVTSYGPVTDGMNWADNFEGTSVLGSSTNKQQLFPINQLFDGNPGSGNIVKNTGTTWWPWIITDTSALHHDTLVLSKGVFSAGDFNYSFIKIPLYFNLYAADLATAWSDDGMIGYVVILSNDQNPLVDSILYPIVFKTSDGGNTWTKKTTYNQNMNLNPLHTLLPKSNDTLTTGYNVDCAVDKNNNLHIAVAVGGYPGGYSINTVYRAWGIFDIYTTDGGNTWCGQLVATPETFSGTFGTIPTQISEDNRQQASRSWDGSKIFITWFDTDTTINGNVGNIEPDMFSKGYDVDNDLWTDTVNLTKNTPAEGFCIFGCVSYYVINKGTDYCIPAVYSDLQGISFTNTTVAYYYIDGACLSGFVNPSSCASLLSVAEINASNAMIKIYPNPLTSSSILELSATANNAEVIIYDMVGKELLRKQFTGNRTEIERGVLESGVYLVRVKAQEREYVEKLVVE